MVPTPCPSLAHARGAWVPNSNQVFIKKGDHRRTAQASVARMGTKAKRTGAGTAGTAPEVAEQLAAVKRVVKPMSVVFWQLLRSMVSTSLGSAKVMSTHCRRSLAIRLIQLPIDFSGLTLYSAAPCCASMTTWMVALSPMLAVKPAGSGTCSMQMLLLG